MLGAATIGPGWMAGAAGARSMMPYGAAPGAMVPGMMAPPGYGQMGPNGFMGPGGPMGMPPGADGAVAVHVGGGGGPAMTPRGWEGGYV